MQEREGEREEREGGREEISMMIKREGERNENEWRRRGRIWSFVLSKL